MRFVFYLLFIVCTSLFSVNTSAQYWDWVKTEQELTYQRIASDGVSKIYIHGGFSGTASIGNTTLTSTNPYSTYVARYDTLGNVLWAKSLVFGANKAFPNDVDVDSAGNVYLCGTYFNTGDTIVNVYLVKYDSSGNQLWSRNYKLGQQFQNSISLNSYASLYQMATDKSGNIFLTGSYSRPFTLNSDVFNSPYRESFIMKFDANGNYHWGKRCRGTKKVGEVNPYAIATDDAGNVVVAGIFRNDDTLFFDNYLFPVPGSNANPAVLWGVYVTKFGTDEGKVLWATTNTLNNTPDAEVLPFDIATGSHGDIYLSGSFRKTCVFGNVTLTESQPAGTIGGNFLVKISAGGVAQWGRNVYPTVVRANGSNNRCNISVNQHDEIFLASELTGLDNMVYKTTISKHDKFGGQDWAVSVIGNNELPESFWGICTDAAHNLYLAGQMFSVNVRFVDTVFLGHHAFPDQADGLSFLAKIIPGVTFPNRVKTVAGGHGLQVFPNPFTRSATLSFHFQQGHDYSLVVTDISGKIVSQKEHLASGEVFIARGDLLPGAYIAQLRDAGALLGTRKLIIR